MSRLLFRRRGLAFTLIELIIIIVVLGLLAGIGVLAYTSVVTTSQDKAAKLALTDVAREASALAAQDGRSEYTEDDWTTALADTTAGPALAGPGVTAAAKLSLVNSAADSTNSSSMSYGQVSLQTRAGGIAGLAMKTQSGHCAFVRAVLPQQVTTWQTGSDLGGNCLASVGLDGGPSGTYTRSDTVISGATPLPPTGLAATVAGSTVNLAWATSTGASSYTVYRSPDNGTTWTKLAGGLTSPAYTDAPGGGGFSYAVTASATNESPKSGAVAVTLLPGVPATVSATGHAAQITVTWAPVTGATSFNVYRDSAPAAVATGLTGTTWTDTTLTADGSTHSYAVSAVNAAGETAKSAAASAMVAPPAPTGLTATVSMTGAAATLSWAATPGATSYSVLETAPVTTTIATGLTGTSTSVPLPSGGVVYTFVVTATDPAGMSANSAAATAQASYAGTVLADAPIAYYRLNDGNSTAVNAAAASVSGALGSATYRATGNATGDAYTVVGNPLTFAHNQTTEPIGRDGAAGTAYFGENGGYLSLPTMPANLTAGGLTVEAWVNAQNSDSWARIVEMGNGPESNNIWLSRYAATTNANMGGRITTTSNVDPGEVSAANTMPLNTWVHLVETFTPGGVGTLYANGVQVAQAGGYNWQQVSRAYNWIGRSSYTQDYYFKGSIAEVAIYNKALTASQVANHYAAR